MRTKIKRKSVERCKVEFYDNLTYTEDEKNQPASDYYHLLCTQKQRHNEI